MRNLKFGIRYFSLPHSTFRIRDIPHSSALALYSARQYEVVALAKYFRGQPPIDAAKGKKQGPYHFIFPVVFFDFLQ
jgi:hypothetical protein